MHFDYKISCNCSNVWVTVNISVNLFRCLEKYNFRKAVGQKYAVINFLLDKKKKIFETLVSKTTRKDCLEPNNTHSKTEIQKVSNKGIGNEDKNKPSNQRNNKKVVVTGDSMLNGISEKRVSKCSKLLKTFLVERAMQS